MAVMGRPTKFDSEKVREIRLPHMPKSLDDRFKKMAKDRGEKPIDMVRTIIVKELTARFLSRPPLQIRKNEKFLNRKYRNIGIESWAEFQVRSLYYNEPATDILMQLMQVEVLRHEKETDLINEYQKPFHPDLSGTTNFTLKLPKPIMQAMVLLTKVIHQPVVAIVHEAIRQIHNPEFQDVEAFDQRLMKNIVQRRLVGVERKLWVEFRKFCIRRDANTNRMLIAIISRFIFVTCSSKMTSDHRSVEKIITLLRYNSS